MVAVYITLIQRGLWTIDQVPEYWRADVKKALEEAQFYQDSQIF